MYSKIINRLKTTGDKEKLSEEIEILLTGLYEEKGLGFESLMQNKVRSWVSEYLKEEFSKPEVDKESFLRGLQEELKNLKDVYLTLAYEPTQDQIDNIASFIKKASGADIILNLSYDPQIIGGVEIVYGGVFRDFSFKRIFEQEFEDTRSEILKELAQHG